MEAIDRKIGIGVLWNLASLFMARGASTLFMLLLARLLAPEAFGLVAMAAVVFELANVFINSGLGAALIQSKTVSEADLNTVFYTNLILSVLAYALMFVSAPVIANFYDQPNLTALIQVMGLVVFLNAAKVVQTAVLSRNMDFRSQMKANTLGVVVSGCLALITAWYGWGVWSLAVQVLCTALVSAMILWLVSQWKPAPQFSGESFSRLFRFGRNLLLENMLDILYRNSHVLVIGRIFSAEITGLYFLARKISDLVSQQLTDAVQLATFPALSTLQEDNVALRSKYRKIMQLMMFLIAPVMALLAGLSPALFAMAFDQRWIDAVPYLQLLCAVGMLYPLHALNINLLNVKGRSDLVLKVGFIKKTVNIALLFLAIPYGVIGIVISQVIGSSLALIPNTYFSSQLVGYSLVDQVKDVIKPIICAVVAGVAAWFVAAQEVGGVFLAFISGGIAGLMLYLVISILLGTEGLIMIRAMIRKRMKSIPTNN